MFISFEGGEGTGKTTQAEELRRRVEEAGFHAITVHEPGSTSLGDHLRAWLKKEARTSTPHSTELFLFAAARAVLVRDVIKPALKQNNMVVIADRYADSSVAYQGYGRRIPIKDVSVVNRLATQGVMPDLTFLLDCPVADGLGRLDSVQTRLPLTESEDAESIRVDEEGTRRFELESVDFHERVRAGYLRIASREPDRWRVVDAGSDAGEVSETVWSTVRPRLNPEGVAGTDVGANLPLWADERVPPTTT